MGTKIMLDKLIKEAMDYMKYLEEKVKAGTATTLNKKDLETLKRGF